MSSELLVLPLVEAKRLLPYQSASSNFAKRRLFLTENALSDVKNTNRTDDQPGLVTAMNRWVSGMRVYSDDRGRPSFLKRLQGPPPDIWEIRVTEPQPQMRIFGRFLEQDTFIATGIYSRASLGRWHKSQNDKWQRAMTACIDVWEALFPDRPPYTGETIHDYISENCDDFAI